MTTVVLSAHLDDAVLSCGGRLTAGSTVATIFAGVPEPGVVTPHWDALTGATDSHARVLERIEEDERALQLLGPRAHRLPFLDGQYRTGGVAPDEVAARLRPLLEDASEVWVPAAIGSHPDHVFTRDVGLMVAAEVGLPVELYADIPYAIFRGWPESVVAEGSSKSSWDAEEMLSAALERSPFATANLTRVVHRLDDAGERRKRAAIAHYASQLPALDEQCGGRLTSGDALRLEVSWVGQASVPSASPPSASG